MKASHFDTDASYMTYKINKTISEKIVRQTHYLAAMHFEIVDQKICTAGGSDAHFCPQGRAETTKWKTTITNLWKKFTFL